MLRPWLQAKLHNSWLDPRDPQFKTNEEFLRAYNSAWAFAQASEGILAFIEDMIAESEGLTKKEKGEVKDKLAESMS